jgi:hypothetical protein
VADHTSILSFIETAFAPGKHLTRRDAHADNLLAMFDFERAPSLDAVIGTAGPPAVDCSPAR